MAESQVTFKDLLASVPCAFYRPNLAAPESWILSQGGLPGSRSSGDDAVFRSDAMGICDIGGNRSGKSTRLVLKAGSYCSGFHPWMDPMDDDFYVGPVFFERRPARVRFVVPNFQVHMPEIIAELRKWWPDDWYTVDQKLSNGIPVTLRWFNGSEWMFMSHKQRETDFEGIEADLVCWNEPALRKIWVALNRGLVSTGGKWIVGATLLDASSWFWEEVVNPAVLGMLDGVDCFWHSTWDNCIDNPANEKFYGVPSGCPAMLAKNVQSWLNLITDPDMRLAREHGHPMAIGGLVLSGWQKTTVIDPIEISPRSIIVSAIDPAGSRPFAGLHIAYYFPPSNSSSWIAYVFDETYMEGQRDIKTFADLWKLKESGQTEPRHPSPSALVLIDPYANEEQKADKTGRSIRQILYGDYEIETLEANRAGKRARLLQLNSRVKMGKYKVFSTCRRLLIERRRWTWDSSSPKLTKGPDDLGDCWGYIDGADPPMIFGSKLEGEEVGGVWRPQEYREREGELEKIRERQKKKMELVRKGFYNYSDKAR